MWTLSATPAGWPPRWSCSMVPVRDRRIGAVPEHTSAIGSEVRPGQLADGRSGGDVGSVARCRGRSGGPIHHRRRCLPTSIRFTGRTRLDGEGGVEPGADPGAGGRFQKAGTLPRLRRRMYACATNRIRGESAIDDMLFRSVTDVLDRHFPDREARRPAGSMTVLAVNTLYRGPAAR